MTKQEFIDQVADRDRPGKARPARRSTPSRHDQDAPVRAARSASPASASSRGRARRPPGREPADRRADQDPRRQGAAVHRRLGAQEGRQGRLDQPAASRRPEPAGGSRPAFRRPAAALVEERRSQVVLGLDPDPAACGRRRSSHGGGRRAGRARAHTAEAVAATAVRRSRPPARRAWRSSSSSPASSGSARPGWEALEDGRAPRARPRPARDRRRQARRRPAHGRAYAQALVGATPSPLGPVPGPRRRRRHGQPAARPRRARAARRGGARRRRRRASCWSARRTRARPSSRTRRGAPLHERLAALVDELGAGRAGLRPVDVGAVVGATQPELLARAARADAARDLPAARRRAPRAARRGPRRRLRAASRRRAGDRLALDRERRTRRRGARPRPRRLRDAAEELRGRAWNVQPEASGLPLPSGADHDRADAAHRTPSALVRLLAPSRWWRFDSRSLVVARSLRRRRRRVLGESAAHASETRQRPRARHDSGPSAAATHLHRQDGRHARRDRREDRRAGRAPARSSTRSSTRRRSCPGRRSSCASDARARSRRSARRRSVLPSARRPALAARPGRAAGRRRRGARGDRGRRPRRPRALRPQPDERRADRHHQADDRAALRSSAPLGRRVHRARVRRGAGRVAIDLRAGERMTVADLLEALLLESANDAAVTLAEASGIARRFVAQMNARRRARPERHDYANPIGLDDPANYSSARDLAALARPCCATTRFARIVDMPRRGSSGARAARHRQPQPPDRALRRVNGVKTATRSTPATCSSARRAPRGGA